MEGEKLKAAIKLGPPMERVLFFGVDGVQKDIMWVQKLENPSCYHLRWSLCLVCNSEILKARFREQKQINFTKSKFRVNITNLILLCEWASPVHDKLILGETKCENVISSWKLQKSQAGKKNIYLNKMSREATTKVVSPCKYWFKSNSSTRFSKKSLIK